MNRSKRLFQTGLLTGLLLAAVLILAGPAGARNQAEMNNNPPVGQFTKTPAECSLLDDEQVRGLMSGMFETKLLIACGRADELGTPGAGQQGTIESLVGTDVQVNDSSGDSGASHTQSETSIAMNETTGTLCSGYNDSYHGVVQGQGYTGYSRSIDGGATFQDQGALSSSSFGDPSVFWRR
ncbi:MAG: hypothetical protein L0322_22275, partial [Chloroflexi bacterium]|nr:hypothetical protein [Chloroflexota bacterium]